MNEFLIHFFFDEKKKIFLNEMKIEVNEIWFKFFWLIIYFLEVKKRILKSLLNDIKSNLIQKYFISYEKWIYLWSIRKKKDWFWIDFHDNFQNIIILFSFISLYNDIMIYNLKLFMNFENIFQISYIEEYWNLIKFIMTFSFDCWKKKKIFIINLIHFIFKNIFVISFSFLLIEWIFISIL